MPTGATPNLMGLPNDLASMGFSPYAYGPGDSRGSRSSINHGQQMSGPVLPLANPGMQAPSSAGQRAPAQLAQPYQGRDRISSINSSSYAQRKPSTQRKPSVSSRHSFNQNSRLPVNYR